MSSFFGWACILGVVGLGALGMFLLLFSPRITIPFWLFAVLSICLPTGLGLFLGAVLDVAFQNNAPVFAAIGAVLGATTGAYYAFGVYRVRLS